MIMYVYIAHRNLKEYCSQNSGFGGNPDNNDYRFGREKERIFTDPDKTLELLGWIASKSIPDRSEEVNMNMYYSINSIASAPRCRCCGADVTGMNLCSECGTKVSD